MASGALVRLRLLAARGGARSGAGADSRTVWGLGLTLGCVAVVAGATAWRLLQRWPERWVLRLSMAAAAAVTLPLALSLAGYGG